MKILTEEANSLTMTDTIVALATPHSQSALGIIRISGIKALKISKEACGVLCPTPRYAHLTKYKSIKNEVLDQIIMVYYEKGKSFTSENCLELTCHGNPFLAEQILSDLLNRGCRLANPGEFTYRAFANGKIDLTQAEAIADLIGAKNKQALMLANKNLDGNLTKKIRQVQSRILAQQSNIEAFIDFPEDGLGDKKNGQVINALNDISSELNRLIEVGKKINVFNRCLKVVLVGPPNVGKSSIFNKIIGIDRSIVNPEAGTTRDFIDYKINLGKITIHLHDTAGIRPVENQIEEAGIKKTHILIQDADLTLIVFDRSMPYPSKIDKEIVLKVKNKKCIFILSKSDLPRVIDLSESNFRNYKTKMVSIDDNKSIISLINLIQELLLKESIIENEFNMSVNLRQSSALIKSRDAIQRSIKILEDGDGSEFSVPDLKYAILNLNDVVEKKDHEDMLDILFSNFCIGK